MLLQSGLDDAPGGCRYRISEPNGRFFKDLAAGCLALRHSLQTADLKASLPPQGDN